MDKYRVIFSTEEESWKTLSVTYDTFEGATAFVIRLQSDPDENFVNVKLIKIDDIPTLTTDE